MWPSPPQVWTRYEDRPIDDEESQRSIDPPYCLIAWPHCLMSHWCVCVACEMLRGELPIENQWNPFTHIEREAIDNGRFQMVIQSFPDPSPFKWPPMLSMYTTPCLTILTSLSILSLSILNHHHRWMDDCMRLA